MACNLNLNYLNCHVSSIALPKPHLILKAVVPEKNEGGADWYYQPPESPVTSTFTPFNHSNVISLGQTHMEAYKIYAEQFALAKRGFGHALWEPDPGEQEIRPDIGAVGYVRNGGWVGFLQALDKDKVGFIQKRQMRSGDPCMSASVRSLEVGIDIGAGIPGGPQARCGFDFSCSKEQGAVLVMGEDADREDAQETGYFIDGICTGYANWLKYANEDHRFGINVDDMILVTGCDKTSSWANAAFNEGSSAFSLHVLLGISETGTAEARIRCSDIRGRYVEKNWGPGNKASRLLQPPDTYVPAAPGSTARDQCVFLRGYKLLDRKTWLKRFGRKRRQTDGMYNYLYPRPRKDGDGGSGSWRNTGSSISLLSAISLKSSSTGSTTTSSGGNSGTKWSLHVPGRKSFCSEWSIGLEEFTDSYETEETDPLKVLLGYILENSAAELAIAHHDDLMLLPIPQLLSMRRFEEILYELKPKISLQGGVAKIRTSKDHESIWTPLPSETNIPMPIFDSHITLPCQSIRKAHLSSYSPKLADIQESIFTSNFLLELGRIESYVRESMMPRQRRGGFQTARLVTARGISGTLDRQQCLGARTGSERVRPKQPIVQLEEEKIKYITKEEFPWAVGLMDLGH